MKLKGLTLLALMLFVGMLLIACTPEAQEPTVTGISFAQEQLTIAPGSQETITAVAMMSDDSTKDITTALDSLTSQDETIATTKPVSVVQATSEALSGDTVEVVATYQGLQASLPITIKYSLEETIEYNDEGLAVIKQPARLDVVVNKERNLPADYEPMNLVMPEVPFTQPGDREKNYLRQEAATALEELFAKAQADEILLKAVSGYRSYDLQNSIFAYQVERKGSVEEANKWSAMPGQSEHQTGLVMDVSAPSVGYALSQNLGQEREGLWLQENAAEFGFIIRYPKGKEEITGYAYEPWHLRYVGKTLAKEIMEQGVTMEEYFGQ